MKEPCILICADADAPMTVRGSVFNHCARCGRAVMVAPTGQQKLREIPDIEIRCGLCFMKYMEAGDTLELAAPLEEMRRERKTMQPNLRRYRN
jgi:hypothetical protein